MDMTQVMQTMRSQMIQQNVLSEGQLNFLTEQGFSFADIIQMMLTSTQTGSNQSEGIGDILSTLSANNTEQQYIPVIPQKNLYTDERKVSDFSEDVISADPVQLSGLLGVVMTGNAVPENSGILSTLYSELPVNTVDFSVNRMTAIDFVNECIENGELEIVGFTPDTDFKEPSAVSQYENAEPLDWQEALELANNWSKTVGLVKKVETAEPVKYSEAAEPVKRSETVEVEFVKNTESTETVKRSETAEPVKQNETAEPVKRKETAEPVKRSETAEPVKRSETAESVKHSETAEPVKRSETVEPVKRSETAEPVKRSETAEPVKQSETVEPVKHSKTAEPVKRSKTAEPVKRSETAEPVKHNETAEPVKRSKTAEPVKRSETAELVKRSETAEPVENSETAEPVKRSETAEPVKQSETAEPVKRSETAEPVKRGENAEPVKRSETAEPVKRSENAERGNSSFSSDRNENENNSFINAFRTIRSAKETMPEKVKTDKTENSQPLEMGAIESTASPLDITFDRISSEIKMKDTFESPEKQLVKGVAENIRKGNKEFTVKLRPEGLGEIIVKLVKNDSGKMLMSMVVSNAKTAELLNSNLSSLQSSLNQHNVEIVDPSDLRASVMPMSPAFEQYYGQNEGGRQSQQFYERNHGFAVYSETDDEESFNEKASAAVGKSGLDIMI